MFVQLPSELVGEMILLTATSPPHPRCIDFGLVTQLDSPHALHHPEGQNEVEGRKEWHFSTTMLVYDKVCFMNQL